MTAPGGTGTLAGRPVARIGYGAMQLAERSGEPVPPGDAAAVLRRAVELGVTHIDTADFYGDGVANEHIRAALTPYPDDLVLATKVGAERSGGSLVAAQRPEQLRAQIEANLARLGVEQVGVANLRRLDAAPGIVATGDQLVDLDDQLAELGALRDEGKIGGIGLSSVTAAQVRTALPAGVTCVQNLYNLLERSDESLLQQCLDHGVAWVPFFPLGSAFADRERVTDHPEVRSIAAARDLTPAQVGLAWLLAHAPNVLLIPGTASVAHLEENMAAGAARLGLDDVGRLDAVRGETPDGTA